MDAAIEMQNIVDKYNELEFRQLDNDTLAIVANLKTQVLLLLKLYPEQLKGKGLAFEVKEYPNVPLLLMQSWFE